MAVDTVKIGGKPVSKKVLYGGGAVALGVVGYAWYTSSLGGTGTAEPEEEVPEPVPEPTDEPGFDVVGGGPPPTTNADWNAKAIQSLLNIGYDAVAAQAAIGKFLQRRSLTSTEAALVEAAIAAAGYPPENPPWVIIRDQPGQVVPPATLPAPTGLRATLLRWNGNTPIYRIQWNPVSGAKDYHWQHGNGSSGFMSTISFDNQGSAPGKIDTWHIAARGVDNKIGPRATLNFTAATKTGTAPTTGKPAVPGYGLNIVKTGRSTYDINFVPPAGATTFKYRRISGGRGTTWATVSASSVIIKTGPFKGLVKIRARALFSKRTTFQVGVLACNSKGCSGEARSNSITLP